MTKADTDTIHKALDKLFERGDFAGAPPSGHTAASDAMLTFTSIRRRPGTDRRRAPKCSPGQVAG